MHVTYQTKQGYKQRQLRSRYVEAVEPLGPGATFTCSDLLRRLVSLGYDEPFRGAVQVRASIDPLIKDGTIEVVSRGVFRLAAGVFDGTPIVPPALRAEIAQQAPQATGTADADAVPRAEHVAVLRRVYEVALRLQEQRLFLEGLAIERVLEPAVGADTLKAWRIEAGLPE